MSELTRCKRALSEWINLSMHLSMRSHFSYFKEKGLSHSQIFTLNMLFHKKECTVGDVSRMLSISTPAASQLLDNLVGIGAVERYESSEDRRVRLHRLTQKGREMMKSKRSMRLDWYKPLVEGMTDEELLKTAEVLELLNNKIQTFDEHVANHVKHMHGECK